MDENFSKIIEQDSEIISFQFLRRNKVKVVFQQFVLVITCGILYLPFYWFDHLNCIFYDKVEEDQSTHVLFENKFSQTFLIQIHLLHSRFTPYEESAYVKYVVFNNIKYQWNNNKKMWLNIENKFTQFINENPFSEHIQPLEYQTAEDLVKFYGKNQIKIEPKNNFNLFIDELLQPLNVYELVLILICILQQEWLYVYFLGQLITVQIILDVYFYKRKIKKINSIANVEQDCIVLRVIDGQQKQIQIKSSQLCIGDVMLVQPKQKFTCDCLIIKGACLIDQSVLTGESIPINKQSIQQDQPMTSLNKILSGSKCIILRTKEVQALILRTSWNTYKGKLVGKIVQQKQKKFKFYYELRFFIILIAIGYVSLAVFQFIDSLKSDFITLNENIMITIEIVYDSFSPVLFFVLTTIYHFISFRLEDKQITAINTEKLQECGRVKNICFDKTGTLTENEIEIFGLAIMNQNQMQEAQINMEIFQQFDNYKILVQLLACCQSLHVIDKQVIGDPIEEQMFKMTQFNLVEENLYLDEEEEEDFGIRILPCKKFLNLCNLSENFYLQILKNFEFTSERKRMSTVVKNMDEKIQSKYVLVSKGAPEIMKQLFVKETLPNDYNEQVKEFSEQGLRLLAMGYKPVDDIEQDVDVMEKDQIFMGFILLDNKIKKETFKVINTLKKNDIDCAMITGDNIYTGISIGYQSGILETGKDIWVGEFDQNSKKIKWIQYNNMSMNSIKYLNSKKFKSTNIINQSIFQSKISQIKSHIGIQKFNIVKQSLINEQTILALEGSAFEKLMNKLGQDEQIKELILKKTKIYGRAIPQEKQLIIQMLKQMYSKEDFCVGFVGDGSNDAKALNEANMGLSIGNNDSSLTASFTTTIDNIHPCIRLLREGKLILDNSIQIYKFSVYEGFSSTFVIFLLALYQRHYHYIYFVIEFLIFMPLYILCANSQPSKLNSIYPQVSLKNTEFVTTLFAPLIIIMIILTLLAFILFNRIENKERENIDLEHNNNHDFFETAIFFLFNNFSQIIMLMAYYKSRPFKKSIFSNKYMLIYTVICSNFLLLLMFHFVIENFYIGKIFQQQFFLPDFQNSLSLKILLYLLVSTILNLIFVFILNTYFLNKKIKEKIENKKKTKRSEIKVTSEKWIENDN